MSDMIQIHNKIYYLGSRRGYWTGVVDIINGMEYELERNTSLELRLGIENILIFSGILDKATDLYPDGTMKYVGADLFAKITIEEKLKILEDIAVREIEFSNEEFRDEYVA